MQKIKNILKLLYYKIYRRRLLPSYEYYKSTDENDKFIHILEAINYLRIAGDNGNVLPQTYFEFGCHSARTFTAAINAYRFFRMSNFQTFAFDSFEGLPATNEDDGYFLQGTFSTSEKKFKQIVKSKTGVTLSPHQVISGFYEDSLSEKLASQLPQIGVLHVDVDLYSSTVEVLAFAKDLLVSGSIILFDDYYCYNPDKPAGELRALNEFLDSNTEFGIIPWKAYSTFGQSFFVKKA